MKTCSKCGETKLITEFHIKKSSKDGRIGICRACKNNYSKKYYIENKEKITEYQEGYRKSNYSYIADRDRKYYEKNRDKKSKYNKEYYLRNRDEIKNKQKHRHLKSIENKREYNRNYHRKNREALIEMARIRNKTRRSYDPLFRLTNNLRRRTRLAIRGRGYRKNTKTFSIIGCSKPHLVNHIENQFADGMGWDNYGDWHVDHIVPLSSAETEDELIGLCHYTNLQPLWASDNMSKGAKLYEEDRKRGER